jgi:tetratricopeptide (TPR) repeat protein
VVRDVGRAADNFAEGSSRGGGPATPGLLLRKSHELFREGKLDAAMAVCDDIVTGYRGKQELAVRVAVARALFVKSEVFSAKDLAQEELNALDELLVFLRGEPEPELHLWFARALFNRASALMQWGRLDEAVDVTRELVEVFDHEEHPGVLGPTAGLLLNAGMMLVARKENQRALRLFETVLERLDGISERGAQKLVVHAAINKAVALGRLGRLDEATAANESVMSMGEPAIEALDDIADSAARSDGPAARERLAWTLMVRAAAIGALGRREETLAAVDDIIDRFRDDQSPFVQSVVWVARRGRGEVLDQGRGAR